MDNVKMDIFDWSVAVITPVLVVVVFIYLVNPWLDQKFMDIVVRPEYFYPRSYSGGSSVIESQRQQSEREYLTSQQQAKPVIDYLTTIALVVIFLPTTAFLGLLINKKAVLFWAFLIFSLGNYQTSLALLLVALACVYFVNSLFMWNITIVLLYNYTSITNGFVQFLAFLGVQIIILAVVILLPLAVLAVAAREGATE